MAEFRLWGEGVHYDTTPKDKIDKCAAKVYSQPPLEGGLLDEVLRHAQSRARQLASNFLIVTSPFHNKRTGAKGIEVNTIHRACKNGDAPHLAEVSDIGVTAVAEALQLRGHTVTIM